MRTLGILLFTFLIQGLLIQEQALAFPDMVRHGYLNCNACHVSVPGGGLLNEYGRTISRELLSQLTFANFSADERDDKFAYGLFPLPSWLLLQSDIRFLQVFSESKQASRARFIIMQVDLDASFQVHERIRLFTSLGRVEPKETKDPTAKDFVTLPRYGAEFLLTKPDAENRVSFRAGRFMPAYGIMFAEHTFATRRLLEFEPGQERFGGEFAWSNDQSSAVITGITAQARKNKNIRETGGIIQVATAIGERSKVGLNYYQTQRENEKSGVVSKYTRRVQGAFAHMGFTKKFYGLVEVDRPQGVDGKWGLIEVFKLGYEIQQGLHLIGVQEYANLNVSESNPKFDAYSIGTEWFPRPHFDFYVLYRRERDTALSNDFQDVAWLLGHFYF